MTHPVKEPAPGTEAGGRGVGGEMEAGRRMGERRVGERRKRTIEDFDQALCIIARREQGLPSHAAVVALAGRYRRPATRSEHAPQATPTPSPPRTEPNP